LHYVRRPRFGSDYVARLYGGGDDDDDDNDDDDDDDDDGDDVACELFCNKKIHA
jgi:hypothetical protein